MKEYKVLLVVAIIWLLFTIIGLARGLVKTVFATFALAAALFIAAAAGPKVGKYLTQTIIYESIYTRVEDSVSAGLRDQVDLQLSDQMAYIRELPLPESLRTGMIENNNKDVYDALGIHAFAEYVASYIATLIVNILSYVLTFLAAFIIIRLLELLCRGLTEIPVLGALDRLCGMALGAFNGIMVIWFGFIVVTMFCAIGWGQAILQEIEQTPVLKLVYEHNYFLSVIQNISKLLF